MIHRRRIDMNRSYLGSGIVGALIVWAFLGGIIGSAVAASFAPQFVVALAIGGALSLSALAVAKVVLFTSDKHRQLDEYESGASRTEEEVRQALANIEARKK